MAELVHTLNKHTRDVNCCSFSSDSQLLASVSGDKSVCLWNVATGEELSCSPFLAHTYSVTACVFSPLGSVLATGSQDCSIIIWEIPSGTQLKTLHGHKGIVRCLTFSPNCQFLVSASSDETACVWDVKTWSLLRKLTGPEVSLQTCRFTPDDLYVVCGSVYGDIRIWECSTGKYESMIQAHDAGLSGVGITGCDFSPTFGAADATSPTRDGESACFLLATCGGDYLLKLWMVHTASAYSSKCNFKLHSSLEGHGGHVWDCRFSNNGKLLVSCSADKTIILWDTIAGQILSKLDAHTRYIVTISLSPDGMYLASGSNDKSVKIWKFNEDLISASSTRTAPAQPVPLQNNTTGTNSQRKLIRNWTMDDVSAWLTGLALEQYCTAFHDNMIDGVELLQINDDMLLNALGITALGHRNKILRELAAVKKVEIEGSIPDEFLCPITREIMVDPVVVADGYTYERSSIVQWFESGKDTSPMMNTPLPHMNLVPNRPLKSAILRFFGPEPINFIV